MAQESIAESLAGLNEIVEPVVNREGFELIDVEFNPSGPNALLRILIDRVGRTSFDLPRRDNGSGPTSWEGVAISDCVRISKALSPVLDVADILVNGYTLEVSSPGINRPLRKPEHFMMACGHQVRIKTRVPIDGETFFIAPLKEAGEDEIVINVRGEDIRIPHRVIRNANLEVEF